MATEDPNVILFEKSSNLKRAEFDPASRTCSVMFTNGSGYRYANFTDAMMADWRISTSAGTWFHANVKADPTAHPVVRIDAAQLAVDPSPRSQKDAILGGIADPPVEAPPVRAPEAPPPVRSAPAPLDRSSGKKSRWRPGDAKADRPWRNRG